MAALWLLVLMPVSCVVTSQQEAPPFRKLRMDPDVHRLSWERNGDGDGQKVACQKNEETPVWAALGLTYCTFQFLSLCHVTNYSVFLSNDRSIAAQIQFPKTDPNRPAAATNLSCSVHDLKQMTCHWGRGRGAPQDVQYRMFWRDTRLGQDQDRECPQYEENVSGDRVGCRLDDVTTLPTQVTVTVNGSSSLAPVSCTDTSVDLPKEEILTPPMLSAVCNGSEEALVSWDMRSHFHTNFQYELQINKSSHKEPEKEETRHSHFRLLNPGSVSFRVRAKPDSNSKEWVTSCPAPSVRPPGPRDLDSRHRHGHRRGADSPAHPTTPLPEVTSWGGAHPPFLLPVLSLRLLTAVTPRFLLRKLFPPIPRMTDPMGDKAEPGEMQVTWGAATEDCEVTHVTET